ncbi:hypothetical protein ACJJVH_21310 (plasmid) [Rhizobium sp. SYY.PMSO]
MKLGTIRIKNEPSKTKHRLATILNCSIQNTAQYRESLVRQSMCGHPYPEKQIVVRKHSRIAAESPIKCRFFEQNRGFQKNIRKYQNLAGAVSRHRHADSSTIRAVGELTAIYS